MSMADRDGVIWLDGELVPWREAKVHVLTHTLHYGLGVFEGVRAYASDKGACIFRLREHTDRVRQVPVDLAILGATHALDQRPEVVEVG